MRPVTDLWQEAERQMIVCNACRYCEGFCAVFQAMELRRQFSRGDLLYLANLCHDCRACYYACQYAPPHEFDINIPKILAQVRTATYEQYAWPRRFATLLGQSRLGASLFTLLCIAVVLGFVLLVRGPEVAFGVHTGEGAFYRVVPHWAMAIPSSAISSYGLAVFAAGVLRFWRDTGGTLREFRSVRAFVQAAKDVAILRYLNGGGEGCNYPAHRFSHARRAFHHLTFYGFMLAFACTTLAAIYHYAFGREAPYPLTHPVVLLGTAGGIMLMLGTAGLLRLKRRSDRMPAEERMLELDEIFVVLLFLTAASGMLTLAVRETAAMGVTLAIHLGISGALLFLAPYSKFAHAVYRSTALVRFAIEQRQNRAGH